MNSRMESFVTNKTVDLEGVGYKVMIFTYMHSLI